MKQLNGSILARCDHKNRSEMQRELKFDGKKAWIQKPVVLLGS